MEIYNAMKPSFLLDRDAAFALPCAATSLQVDSALRTIDVQGIAACTTWADATMRTEVTTVARDRVATTGIKGHLGFDAVYVPGLLAWSPPI